MSKTKVVTGKVRFSYAHVFTPQAVEEGGEKKYSVQILIPKKDKALVAKMKAAIQAAYDEGVDKKFGGKAPKKWTNPLRDGDDEKDDDEAYVGHYFVSAKSKTKPKVVDRQRDEILDEGEFYSGCYGVVSINFYPYNVSGCGVAAGLNNIMKTHEGENLGGGKSSVEDDFGDISFDDDMDFEV